MDLLLDTSVLIDTLRGHRGRRELLARLVEDGHRLSTTALNAAEVWAGVRTGEESQTSRLLDSLECYSLNNEGAKRTGLRKNSWASQGKTLSLPDVIVAAIAIERNCTVLTDNRRDFPMPEVKLYALP